MSAVIDTLKGALKKVLVLLGTLVVGLFLLGLVLKLAGFKSKPRKAEEVAPASPALVRPPAASESGSTGGTVDPSVVANGVEIAAPDLTPDQRKTAGELLTELRGLSFKCHAMEPFRGKGAGSDQLSECSSRMRRLLPEAEKLDQRSRSLPVGLNLTLGVAATELRSGCSCSDVAAVHLDRADLGLAEAEKILAPAQ